MMSRCKPSGAFAGVCTGGLMRPKRHDGPSVPGGQADLDNLDGRAAANLPEEALRPVSFAACYVYSPRGRGAIAAGSRTLRARLKSGDPAWLARYAVRVQQLAAGSGRYAGFFGPDVVLVPVPRSRPIVPGAVWAAERLAMELAKLGLAGSVWAALFRCASVRKSATCPLGDRPTVAEHYRSLAAGQPLDSCRDDHPVTPGRLLLVDDVVTKGRTLLAAAARLRELCPASEVRSFALARTMGFARGIEHMVTPCQGEIRWNGADALRRP
jgi:hypothetical protein